MARRTRPTAAAAAPVLAAIATPTKSPAAERKERPSRRRSYEGGDMGRLLADWVPPASSANPEVYFDLPTLRNRSRDQLRNNGLAVKGIQSLVSAIVGPGIHPQPISTDPKLNAKVQALWSRWASGELDVSHDRTWASLLSLWVRAMLESGGVVVRKRTRRLSDGAVAVGDAGIRLP